MSINLNDYQEHFANASPQIKNALESSFTEATRVMSPLGLPTINTALLLTSSVTVTNCRKCIVLVRLQRIFPPMRSIGCYHAIPILMHWR
mgnify:CR=1 FL=1